MKEKVDFLVRDYEVEKTVVKYPNVEDYFIACERNSLFIEEFLEVYVDLLVNEGESKWLEKLDRSEELVGMTDVRRIYEQGHFIAAHIVLQQRQKILDKVSETKKLAIDELSLLTINSRLGPTKI